MSTAVKASVLCTICYSNGVLRCVQCHSVQYCSKECQRRDWPAHKLLCSSFSDFRVPPGPQFKRAILFPVDEKTPKFIWVEVTIEHEDDTGVKWEKSKLKGLLGPGNPFAGRPIVQINLLRNRELDHTIEVVHRDTFMIDGSLPNQSIIEVTKGDIAHIWAGPIIAFRKMGLGTDPHFYDHITLSDFRHTVDYFLTYNKSSVTGDGTGDGKVKGVRISCNADQRVLRKDKYIPVDVPDWDPVFAVKEPIGISRLIELPILVRKYPPDRAWSNDPQADNYDNQAVTFLHLNVDPMSPSFGWAPLHWQNEVGSVLIARADRKPLSPHHMEALCYFCQFKMQPLFEDSLGAGFVERTRENVMGHMTKAKFEKFFTKYRAERMEEDSSWTNTPSPYAI